MGGKHRGDAHREHDAGRVGHEETRLSDDVGIGPVVEPGDGSCLRQLIDKTAIPFVTTQMGKGVVDETDPLCLGNTALSSGDFVHRAVEAAAALVDAEAERRGDPALGTRVGPYRITERLGAGGMGVVYRAVRDSDSAEVALKILSCDSAWNKETFVARFEREIRALSRLDHPNVVRIKDSGREGDIHYLVTEYIPGENLAERMRRGMLICCGNSTSQSW